MKAQISTEYIMIVGFALLLTIPTVIIFYSQSSSNLEQINSMQAKSVARKIVDNAEKVYYLGKPSVTTIKVLMPQRMESVSISGRELVISIRGSAGVSDVVEVADVNMSGSITSSPGGLAYIRIENIGDRVNITSS